MRNIIDLTLIPFVIALFITTISVIVAYYIFNINTTSILIWLSVIGFFTTLYIVLTLRWWLVKLPKYNKESAMLQHSIDGNIAILNLSRYIRSNNLTTVYVSRDMFDAFFRADSTFRVRPLYHYFVHNNTLIRHYTAAYTPRRCKLIVDPYRKGFNYGLCMNNSYITSIEDLYS